VLEGRSATTAGYKMWLLPLEGERRLRPLAQPSTGSQAHPMFSPDGRLVAYTSDESGVAQVYVQAVDGSSGRWQISTEGGDLATWRGDGRELFYVGADRVLRAVPITGASPLVVGDAAQLFRTRIQSAITSEHSYYMPSADGQRFLLSQPSGPPGDPALHVLMGWTAQGPR